MMNTCSSVRESHPAPEISNTVEENQDQDWQPGEEDQQESLLVHDMEEDHVDLNQNWVPEAEEEHDSSDEDSADSEFILALSQMDTNESDVHTNCDLGQTVNILDREPGLHLPGDSTQDAIGKYLNPKDFFQLFFTEDFVSALCEFTNQYGQKNTSLNRPWTPISVEEFYKLLGLLMYMTVVKVPKLDLYWSRKSLLYGLWARRFMKIIRFKRIMGFLTISHEESVDPSDKLAKARYLVEYINEKCIVLFQPKQTVPTNDEARKKESSSLRQYEKHIRRGLKLCMLKDSKTGYTHTFEVKLGKATKQQECHESINETIGPENTLTSTRKLKRARQWWKSLLLHLINVARVNSYVLFQEFRKAHPDVAGLKRSSTYDQSDFTFELIRQLGGIAEEECVPLGGEIKMSKNHPIVPYIATRKNCKLCYAKWRIERKTRYRCNSCETPLCLRVERNCLLEYHLE